MKILVAVLTCEQRFSFAKAQRDTWVQDCGFGEVKFFLGRSKDADPECALCFGLGSFQDNGEACSCIHPRPAREGEVFLNVADDYAALVSKKRAICAWADRHDYDLMLKIDDDVVMFPTRVVIPKGHYTGWKQEPASDNWCSGLAHWLSRDAMRALIEAPLTCQIYEDRWTGKALLAAGIRVEAIEQGGIQWVGRQRPLPVNIKAILSRAYVAGEFTAEEMPLVYRW